MTKEEMRNMPENIDMLLGLSVTMHTRQRLKEKLEKICELAIKALEQYPDYPELSHSEMSGLIYVYFRDEKFEITKQAIEAVEAIKALEQEKTGHWIWCGGSHKCSNCEEYACFSHKELLRYCPNCGAKMSEIPTGSESEV